MNTSPVAGNPFYRWAKTQDLHIKTEKYFRNVTDREEIVEKLVNTEAALKNSEEMNLKLVRSRKEIESKFQDIEKQLRDTKTKLATTQILLRAKEEECNGHKSKLSNYNNKEGTQQTIDELTAQLMEKESVIQMIAEETKIKEDMLKDAAITVQKMGEERILLFEQAQKFKVQLDFKSSLEEELQQIKIENNNMAGVIFEHEKLKNQLQE